MRFHVNGMVLKDENAHRDLKKIVKKFKHKDLAISCTTKHYQLTCYKDV